jgi:NAD(P)-dependent dehydrogenase (short-subunit alcohol dehydrogenase family)
VVADIGLEHRGTAASRVLPEVLSVVPRRGPASSKYTAGAVLVVGGSRGLGLLVARQLAAEGARLTLAARDAGELERARDELASCGAEVRVIPCDIASRADAEQLVGRVVRETGSLDVLMNIAGVIQVGPVDHMTVADFEEAMAVHFWGPLHTTLAAVPVMRRQGAGRIVNVSSIGGRIGVPHLVPYCASKFALTGFSDAIRGELAKDGIWVTTVLPGLMRTGSPFNAWFKGQHRAEFAWFTIADSLPLASIDANRAAAQLLDACRHGDAELVISWPAKLAIMANAIAPEAVAVAMNLANALILPAPSSEAGLERHSGWQSDSTWAPSRLTRPTERAAAANNELPR